VAGDKPEALPRNARKRAPKPGKPGSAEHERREQAALLGEGEGKRAETEDEVFMRVMQTGGLSQLPTALRDVVAQKGPQGDHVRVSPGVARAKSSELVQFDVLLALTKPIFPLVTLIATGEAYNGLIFVMVTTRMLRKVPFLGVEGLHIACALCGFLHTILGVSSSAISLHQSGMLELAWHWSLKDVAMVANVALTGATFTSLSRLGNEPPFTASFASGVALRLLALELMPPAWLPDVNAHLAPFNVRFAPVDEIATRSRNGVGSCAGGFFRWMAGDTLAAPFALVCKGFLLTLPLLAAAQWILRGARFARRFHRVQARRRAIASMALGIMGALQVGLLLVFQLNGINGAMPNFWLACLLGVVWESLLSTFNVLGRMRGALMWALYVLL